MLTGTAGVRRPPPPGAIFGLTTIVVTLVLNRHGSRRVTIALGLLSIAVSTRYLHWRATETLHFRSPIEAAFGLGLYLAELYAWAILVLNAETW